MDWLTHLGKHVDSLPPDLPHGGVETLFPPGEAEGESNPFYIASLDGSWEARLGDDGSLETIFLYARNGAFLPKPLHVTQSRSEVRAALGVPSRSGEGSKDPVLGDTGPWDRFDSASASIHVEYASDGAIGMVTLMRPGAAP